MSAVTATTGPTASAQAIRAASAYTEFRLCPILLLRMPDGVKIVKHSLKKIINVHTKQWTESFVVHGARSACGTSRCRRSNISWCRRTASMRARKDCVHKNARYCELWTRHGERGELTYACPLCTHICPFRFVYWFRLACVHFTAQCASVWRVTRVRECVDFAKL